MALVVLVMAARIKTSIETSSVARNLWSREVEYSITLG